MVGTQDITKFGHILLDIAEEMLACGAEIDRVEGTLLRMGYAYGAEKVNVFAITSSVVITLEMSNGDVKTQTRRVLRSGPTDFERLEALNNLSREYCKTPFSIDELRLRFKECLKPFNRLVYYAGSVIASSAFACFFGGTLWDGIAAGVFSLLICYIMRSAPKFCPNDIVSNFLCSLIIGFVICLSSRVLTFLNYDKIIMGDIMLLIPGLAFVNAIRNVITGDTVSGVIKLVESVIKAVALAGGFMIAIAFVGG